jgi:hypothetical protein
MAAAAATAEAAAPMEQAAMPAEVATRPRGARHGRNEGIAARGAAPVAEAVTGSLIYKQG